MSEIHGGSVNIKRHWLCVKLTECLYFAVHHLLGIENNGKTSVEHHTSTNTYNYKVVK
jgi:hypothetical protein